MTNNLPTDTYYRGYRLSTIANPQSPSGQNIKVYSGPDWVDTFLTGVEARAQIDDWVDTAR